MTPADLDALKPVTLHGGRSWQALYEMKGEWRALPASEFDALLALARKGLDAKFTREEVEEAVYLARETDGTDANPHRPAHDIEWILKEIAK